MHDEPVDFSQVRFRDTDIRHIPRHEEPGTPFWRIVGAVFVALCLYGILQTLVTMAVVRHAVKDLERQMQSLFSEPASPGAPAAAATHPYTPAPRPATPALPGYAGPVDARRAGQSQACIGGFVSNRVEGGWSQTRRRCRALSE